MSYVNSPVNSEFLSIFVFYVLSTVIAFEKNVISAVEIFPTQISKLNFRIFLVNSRDKIFLTKILPDCRVHA